MLKFIFLLISFSFCQNKNDILIYVNKIEKKYSIPEYILPAIIQVESSFDQKKVSHLFAYGLMQITSPAFIDFTNYTKNKFSFECIKTNWKSNIDCGAWYLKNRCKGDTWKEKITSYFWGSWHTNKTENYYKKVSKLLKTNY